MKEDFKQANVFTAASDIQILASKPENPKVTRRESSPAAPTSHTTGLKNYIIPDGDPCDFLIRLGVMDKSGKVIPKHYGKFRQINRYLEIVSDSLPYLAESPSFFQVRLR